MTSESAMLNVNNVEHHRRQRQDHHREQRDRPMGTPMPIS
jgi:hypothetical protein